MMRVPFNYTWRLTDYCLTELDNFIECADGFEDGLRDRYIAFLQDLSRRKIKKATEVDLDVLREFILDLENRAQIDYIEGHWDDEPSIVRGGQRFLKRAKELRKLHPELP